ncbi:MAG TPA: hypothetical protein VK724_06880 [Bryobacteraceae bacterium]|jgi:hypothetical protein|nr:hypothetical protein [Bryobacteraceae bacterium]
MAWLTIKTMHGGGWVGVILITALLSILWLGRLSLVTRNLHLFFERTPMRVGIAGNPAIPDGRGSGLIVQEARYL